MARPWRTMRSRCERFIEVSMREVPSYGTRCMRRRSKVTEFHSTLSESSMRLNGSMTLVYQLSGASRTRLLIVSTSCVDRPA